MIIQKVSGDKYLNFAGEISIMNLASALHLRGVLVWVFTESRPKI